MNFAILRREGVSRHSRLAAQAAIKNVERSLSEYDRLLDQALQDPRLSKASKSFLRALWLGDARGEALSLGNRAVHQAATVASIIVLLVHAQGCRDARQGRLRFRMLTTSPDLGITDFASPQVDFAAIGRHFDHSARFAHVDALGFMDVALIDDRTSPQSMKIAWHMHSAIRAKALWFRTKYAERAASPVLKPINEFGLRVCKITSKRRDWGKSLRRSQVSGLGYYIAKRSCGLKLLFHDRGRRRSKSALHGWTLIHALRQLECYSHCDALATTRGVGEGKNWRRQWKAIVIRLLKLSGTPHGLKINHKWLERNWQRVWLELGIPGMQALQVC